MLQADEVPLAKIFVDAPDLDLSKVEPNGKIALVTGITGQDGSYLAELLLEKGYVVHGIVRRSSSFNTGRIEHMYRDKHSRAVRLFLEYGDLTDSSNLCEIIARIKPHEIYNLAAQSHVKVRTCRCSISGLPAFDGRGGIFLAGFAHASTS